MTRDQFLVRLSEEYERNVNISKAKNRDYATGDNPFSNFEQIENLTNGRVSTVDGILTRISDKMSRVMQLLASAEGPAVHGESIGDTCADAANYFMILKIYIEEKYKKEDNFLRHTMLGGKPV